MNKDSLTVRQLACVTTLYIIGSSSVIGSSGIAGKDTWIAMLAALAAAIPLVLMYARVSKLYPGQNLFDMIYSAFGDKAGWLAALLTTLYCFTLGAMVLRDFPEFVNTASLPKTPKIVFTLLLGLVCAYLAWLGASSFGKAGIFFSWLVGGVVLLTFVLLIPNMDLQYLRPVLSAPPGDLALNAAKLLSTPFGETVLLLCLFCSIKDNRGYSKAFVTGLLFGGFYLTISVLRNILTLGAGNFSSLYFPSYSAVGTINIGDFFQRVEVMVASYLLICDVIKVAIAVYAVCLGVTKLFRLKDYKSAALPVTLLMVPASVYMFDSTMRFYSWSPMYFLFTAPFQLLLPLLLWIIGEARNRQIIRRAANQL